MQVSRLVIFHKALADVTRIRILALLKTGPLHGQALAGKLGVKPPTITHHISKLREVGLIYQRRDKNTIYFYLDEKTLAFSAQAIVKLIEEGKSLEDQMEQENERYTVIKNFFDSNGKLKQIPAQRKKKLYVLEHIIRSLKIGVKYPEKEVNQYIKNYHDDFATIRREFIMNNFMFSENGIYELNPPELWGKINK